VIGEKEWPWCVNLESIFEKGDGSIFYKNGLDFSGETFRVLKEKEIKQFAEYRTRRLVLKAWDRLGVK